MENWPTWLQRKAKTNFAPAREIMRIHDFLSIDWPEGSWIHYNNYFDALILPLRAELMERESLQQTQEGREISVGIFALRSEKEVLQLLRICWACWLKDLADAL